MRMRTEKDINRELISKIEGLERDFEDRMEGVMEKKMDEMERY